jgi:hypothetical protein
MAFSFCTDCGNKMSYTLSPPNFCGKCGTKLNSFAAANTVPKRGSQRQEEDEDSDSDEFSNSDEIPSLSSLAYEIEGDSSGNKSYQLGELFGQPRVFSRKNRPMSLDELKSKHAKT